MATKTANMSFNYCQNGKYGSFPNSSQNVDVSPDMHLKMSKKIAQLTKVIYALNTKNDEHEAILQSTKKDHEEKIQQLLAETKEKIESYKKQVVTDVNHIRKIESLESCLQKQQGEREDALLEFQEFKRNAEEREIQLKRDHSQKMLALSHETLTVKRNFESMLQKVTDLKTSFEEEKNRLIEEMEEKHRKELSETLNSHKTELDSIQNAKRDSQQCEVDKLNQRIETLLNEKQKVIDDYEAKLNKAQAFYEKELQVLKSMNDADSQEKLQALIEQTDILKKGFAFQEDQLTRRVEGLINDLSLKEEELSKLQNEMQSLQQNLKNSQTNSANLDKALEESTQETSRVVKKLKETETELIVIKERCNHQSKDLIKKSYMNVHELNLFEFNVDTNIWKAAVIGELEATKLQNESSMKDMQAQLAKQKDKIAWLEGSKNTLESNSQSQFQQKEDQLKALEKALEALSVEKQDMKETFEEKLKRLDETSNEKLRELSRQHQTEISDIQAKFREEAKIKQKAADAALASLKQDLEAQMEAERQKFWKENETLQNEMDRMKAELTSKLTYTETELKRLEAVVRDGEQGLGSASSHIDSLKQQIERMKAELDHTRNDLRSSKTKASSLQSELDKLKMLHDSKIKEAQVEMKSKLTQLSKDLDDKWTATLRKECAKLRHDLTEQKNAELKAELTELTKLKDEEIMATRDGWQKKVNELLSQISDLKRKLDSQEELSSGELERLRKESDIENRRLAAELQQLTGDYDKKISVLEKSYRQQIKKLKEERNRDIKEVEERLKSEHMKELESQVIAHRASLQSAKDTCDKTMSAELQALEDRHQKHLESHQTELEHKQAMELEQINRTHQLQLQAARMELQRAMEITRQKEGEHAMKVAEFEEELRHGHSTVENLEEEIKKLNRAVSDMTRELENKAKDIFKIRSETDATIRKREEELQDDYRGHLSSLKTDHRTEIDNMLAEFTQAQNLLKDKILELQLMLEEAEDRYKNRESRTEDIERIRRLKEAVIQREHAVRKIEEEKRYFQRELMNRETNFNKVFSTSPNVGVLNPLAPKKTKISDKAQPMKFSSAPSLHSRLEPLPGSPLHDEKLNHSRPLPPTLKKFVK